MIEGFGVGKLRGLVNLGAWGLVWLRLGAWREVSPLETLKNGGEETVDPGDLGVWRHLLHAAYSSLTRLDGPWLTVPNFGGLLVLSRRYRKISIVAI